MIEFVDPRAERLAPEEPYEHSVDLDAPGVTLGLLANGFPDSVAFLEEIGRVLARNHPGLSLHAFDKGNASIVAGADLLAGITKECQAVVTAYGH